MLLPLWNTRIKHTEINILGMKWVLKGEIQEGGYLVAVLGHCFPTKAISTPVAAFSTWSVAVILRLQQHDKVKFNGPLVISVYISQDKCFLHKIQDPQFSLHSGCIKQLLTSWSRILCSVTCYSVSIQIKTSLIWKNVNSGSCVPLWTQWRYLFQISLATGSHGYQK
jgi:hypothetical protein